MPSADGPENDGVTDPQVAKWTGWIEGAIQRSVIRMNFHRQIWRGVQQVIQANQQLPPSAYWAYHLEVYVDAQAIAVRRQADLDARVASLARLMQQISEEPERLTRDWWLQQWGPEDDDHLSFARGRWATDFGGEIGTHLDPVTAKADLSRLSAAASSVRTYVNRHVAHSEDLDPDNAPPPAEITLGELDAAIDVIGDLFRRYLDLLVCVDMDLHVYMSPGWLEPFRQAWIPGSS